MLSLETTCQYSSCFVYGVFSDVYGVFVDLMPTSL